MLSSITREIITNDDDLMDFGLELGCPLSLIQQKRTDYARNIEMASFMLAVEWWFSCTGSRANKYKSLLKTVRFMGKRHTDVAVRLESVLNREHLSGFRSPGEQYLSTVENIETDIPFGNESKPQNESLSDSESIEGNGENPIITYSRSKGKEMTVSGVKIDSSLDTLNLDYNRLATFPDSDNVYISYLDQFDNNDNTGRERLIRSHSSARFCFELSGNSN